MGINQAAIKPLGSLGTFILFVLRGRVDFCFCGRKSLNSKNVGVFTKYKFIFASL